MRSNAVYVTYMSILKFPGSPNSFPTLFSSSNQNCEHLKVEKGLENDFVEKCDMDIK